MPFSLFGGSSKKPRAKPRPRNVRAGIWFPVGRIHRHLKKGNYAWRIRRDASVHLATTLEYLCAEMMELAGGAAKDNKRKRITPHDLQLAVSNDEELDRLLKNTALLSRGVMPQTRPKLRTYKPARAPKRRRGNPAVNNAHAKRPRQMEVAIHDAGQMDVATHDAGQMDVAIHDAGQMDVATHDAGQMDVATHDAGQMDVATHAAGQMDVATHAAGQMDAAPGTIEAREQVEME